MVVHIHGLGHVTPSVKFSMSKISTHDITLFFGPRKSIRSHNDITKGEINFSDCLATSFYNEVGSKYIFIILNINTTYPENTNYRVTTKPQLDNEYKAVLWYAQ